MGLFDTLFGGSKSRQSGKVVTDQDVKSTAVSSKAGASSTQTGQVAARAADTATQRLQKQFTLDPEIQAFISSLITETGGRPAEGAGGAELQGVAEQLLARAGGTQEFVDQRKADILTAAEQRGKKQVEATRTQAERAAGSSFNTLAQLAGQEAENELTVDLAGLGAQLDLSGREAETAALAQAFSALAQSGEVGATAGLENIRVVSDLVQSLKGATSVTEGTIDTQATERAETQTTENQIQQLIELITQTQEGRTVQTQEGEAKQGGSFDVIDLLPLLLD